MFLLWVTPKSIEEDEKWALKREEQEKKIRKSKIKWIKSIRLNPSVFGYLLFHL